MIQNDGAQAVRQVEAGIGAFLAEQSDGSRSPGVRSPRATRRSSGVTLRSLASGDQGEFLDLVGASTDLHRPWMSPPSTPQEFQAYLSRYEQPEEESLLICVRSTGAIVGLVNINSIIRGRFQCGSLAYAAFAPTAGQGYMCEGLDLVVRYAFEQLRFEGEVVDGRASSGAAAE